MLEDEEHSAASLCERQVLGRDFFNLLHDNVRLFHLASDLGSLALESLQGVDDLVVVEDVTHSSHSFGMLATRRDHLGYKSSNVGRTS